MSDPTNGSDDPSVSVSVPAVIASATPDLIQGRTPKEVLAEAERAAKALAEMIRRKKDPVLFRGEQYLEYEDWMLLARFYGVSVRTNMTRFVEFGTVVGFEASASAILISTGQEISAAEAMCLNDEENWQGKPLYQLRSMAQTRACSKALRNVLAWVAVLAGCKPTPDEEMDDPRRREAQRATPPVEGQPPFEPTRTRPSGRKISEGQAKRFYAIFNQAGHQKADVMQWLQEVFGITTDRDIDKNWYEAICARVASPAPFPRPGTAAPADPAPGTGTVDAEVVPDPNDVPWPEEDRS